MQSLFAVSIFTKIARRATQLTIALCEFVTAYDTRKSLFGAIDCCRNRLQVAQHSYNLRLKVCSNKQYSVFLGW